MPIAELKLWGYLRDRRLDGYKFWRQHPIGPYVVDFVCLEKNLVIELDGEHHSSTVQADAQRSAWLQARGYHVLRFWNNQVWEETEGVMASILATLRSRGTTPHLSPLPQGERRQDGRPMPTHMRRVGSAHFGGLSRSGSKKRNA
jgi:very-short-patch-repair endonuclease